MKRVFVERGGFCFEMKEYDDGQMNVVIRPRSSDNAARGYDSNYLSRWSFLKDLFLVGLSVFKMKPQNHTSEPLTR